MQRRTVYAQIGGGDPSVLAGPGFRSIPKPKFTLRAEKAVEEYDRLARKIFDAGRLNEESHFLLSGMCSIIDKIETVEQSGKPPSASWYTELIRYRRDLGINDLDQPIAAPASAPLNKFARTGLANRRR